MKNSFKIAAVAMAALMAAPHMTTIAQAASVHDVMASNGKTIIERTVVNKEVKTGPEVTKCEYVTEDANNSFVTFAEIDRYAADTDASAYANAINNGDGQISVNGTSYSLSQGAYIQNSYYVSIMDGFVLNLSAFKEGANIISIKVPGYADKEITINLNGQTASFISQKDAGSTGDTEQQPVADGVYTLSFTANEEGKDTPSMLQGVFDPNVKLTVQNGEMKISMLNTGLVSFLLDFSVESDGVYPKATRVDVGTPDSTGQYPAQEFTFSISELEKEHKGAVLVTAMGGQISDIGNYDKYTKLDMMFSNMQKGWEGYTFQETAAPDGNEALTEALINEGYDTDGNKSISTEEIQAITGEINLADYGLTDISMLAGNLSDKVTSLNLSGNKISELPADLLKTATGLEKLYLQNNLIYDIPEDFFANSSNLKLIYMSTNMITGIETGDMDGLDSVSEIDFGTNRIVDIESEAFSELDTLTSLALSNNNIEEIPDDFAENLKNLSMLFIDNNKLAKIPNCVSEMNNLSSFYADHNAIESISNIDFSGMKNLKTVNLASNSISEISTGTFADNANLDNLYLSDNNITEFKADILPEGITMNSLDLQLNRISAVDDEVRNIVGKDGKVFPQKTVATPILTADKDGHIICEQTLSLLDLLLWYDSTTSSMDAEITDMDGYIQMLENEGYTGKSISEIMDEKGYDWDIKTEVQKKNADGSWTVVSEEILSDQAETLSGSFNADENGVYRIVKSLYSTTYGDKAYKFAVASEGVEVNMDTTGGNTDNPGTEIPDIEQGTDNPQDKPLVDANTGNDNRAETDNISSDNNSSKTDNVKTGDESNYAAAGIMAITAAAAGATLAFGRKKKN